MSILNLGIVAHVDAGKTSLTERLLFDAGVIDRLGSVDAGSTQTDTLELERRRGITIKSAVATFAIGGTTVNLIDTPGHPDFIAEVERALRVLDGAVLVVSAVEGVQAQTRVLLRTLDRLRVPTLLLLNKTDRRGADPDRVVASIPGAVPMWREHAEALAEHDDEALAAYLADAPIPATVLARLTAEAKVRPAFRGSAITGEGMSDFSQAIAEYLPKSRPNANGPLKATVFKIDRDRAAYVRIFTGRLTTRDLIAGQRVTAIDNATTLTAGQIGRVHGLTDLRIGDTIGAETTHEQLFAPPTLETTITAADRPRLHQALAALAAQDPLINLRLDEESGELTVSLYGEVQKEVIRDTLRDEYGLEVTFGETVTVHVERPAGSARAGAVLGRDGNPHLATLELLVEPGEGVHVAVPVEDIPLYVYKNTRAFHEALQRYVHDSLARGGNHGWDVEGARVTVTRCGYQAPSSTAADYRRLVPVLLRQALREAGTHLCAPVHRFTVEAPTDTLSALLAELPRHGAVPDPPVVADGKYHMGGWIAAERITALERALPGLTRGEGTLETRFEGYRENGRHV